MRYTSSSFTCTWIGWTALIIESSASLNPTSGRSSETGFKRPRIPHFPHPVSGKIAPIRTRGGVKKERSGRKPKERSSTKNHCYITQTALFVWSDYENSDDLDRLDLILDTIPDEALMHGYTLHLIVDTQYELPVSFTVLPASHSEMPVAHKLIDGMAERNPHILKKCEYFSGDRGDDDTKFHKKLWDEHQINPSSISDPAAGRMGKRSELSKILTVLFMTIRVMWIVSPHTMLIRKPCPAGASRKIVMHWNTHARPNIMVWSAGVKSAAKFPNKSVFLFQKIGGTSHLWPAPVTSGISSLTIDRRWSGWTAALIRCLDLRIIRFGGWIRWVLESPSPSSWCSPLLWGRQHRTKKQNCGDS